MKSNKKIFRKTEISKACALACVAGLMLAGAGQVLATDYNVASQPIVVMTSTNSVNVFYSGGGSGSFVQAPPATHTIRLNSGVWLTGETGRGALPVAVYTTPNGDDDYYFSANTSILELRGNNQVTGIVGAHWNGTTLTPDQLTRINILNTGNYFNDQVHAADINLNSGSAVQFLGNVGGTLNGSSTTARLNYLGSNSEVTIGDGVTVTGSINNTSISNSLLTFNGSGTVTGNVGTSSASIGTVRLNGDSAVVRFGGNLSTDHLDYRARATVAVTGDLYLNVDTATDALNVVTFGNTQGVLQVDGDIVGRTNKDTITTTVANTGTVTMVNGAQAITGNVGTGSLAIGTLNIGGANSGVGIDTSDNVASTTTANGNIFAQNIVINNNDSNSSDSTLIMATGYNLTGTVAVESGQNKRGNLTLQGGTQTVTGTVGALNASLNTVTSGAALSASTFTGVIYAQNVNNGSGTSNYQADVFADYVNVSTGTANFERSLARANSGDVTRTTTTIGAGGTGNFNTTLSTLGNEATRGTTVSDIQFSGASGTANLYNGMTGDVRYAGHASTVNLWDSKQITGNVSTATNNSTGTLNARGSGVLNGTVGASGMSINTLAVNTNNQQTGGSLLQARGNIFASIISLQNDGTLELIDGVNATGNIVTTANNTGTLTLTGNSDATVSHVVTGNVGAAGMALKRINAGSNNETDTFTSGTVYAETLRYSGVGNVVFNGLAAAATSGSDFTVAAASDLGFVGTVDFVSNTASATRALTLGNNVDLITENATSPTANTQTAFRNANGSKLVFAGNSVVTGVLGSATNANTQNFAEIYAGANGSVVSFRNDVYVSANTFHVSGTGSVNFMGNLNGPLVYDADGFVNVADGKVITGTVTNGTGVNGRGTLNFVGGTTTNNNIGADTATGFLKAVNFHASTTVDGNVVLPVTEDDVTVNIGHNIYALNTTIGTGQRSGADATVANITSGVYLGNALTLTASNVTLNTAGTVVGTDAISPVNFAHTKNANGTLTNTATVTQSATGTGAITTNGATLNFAVGTTAWADPVGSVQGAGGTVSTASSSRITGGAGSTLILNGNERVNLSLLGSLRDGQTYTLINVQGGVDTADNNLLPNPSNVKDNSYVIDTTLSRVDGESGDLVMTATRANNVYITASSTTGHFSNPAALRLGTLAAAGSDYGQDMQTALNMLDIDQWGYGNNQANLAVQAKRLAPIANNSIGLSMFRTSSMVSDNIGLRMHEMRISEQAQRFDDKGFWIRSMYQQGKQSALGAYDGFDSKISGFTMGIDARPNRESILGAALSYSNTKVEQRDFRSGDQATANTWHLSLYGAYDFTPELFVDGVVTASTGNLDSARATAVGRTAKADTDVNQITGKVNLGYRFKLPDTAITITPLLSYEGSTLRQDAYRESGAGDIGLSTPSQRLNWNRAGVGLRLATTTMWGGMVAKPELTVMAQNENGNFAKPITSQFIGDYTNTAFTTTVADKSAYSRSSVRGILGLNLLMSKSSSLSVRYDHTNGDDFKSNAFDLMARWNF